MPEDEQEAEPLKITPSLHQWLERCAVRRCDPEHRSALLSCFGPMIQKQLRRFPESAAARLRSELFRQDIVGEGERQRDRSIDNLVGFCDRLYCDFYKDQTDEMSRGLKAHLFSLEPLLALGELSQFRFHALIKKALHQEYSLATTPILSKAGKASLKKHKYFPESVDSPHFAGTSSDALWCENVPSDSLPDVSELLTASDFGDLVQRILWLRNYTTLFNSEEAAIFTGLGRSQLHNVCNNHSKALKKWLSENLTDFPRAAQFEFVRQVLDAIEERLLREGAIPNAWLAVVRPSTATQP